MAQQLNSFFLYLIETGRSMSTATHYVVRVRQLLRALGGFTDPTPSAAEIERYVRTLPKQHWSSARSAWRAFIEYAATKGVKIEPLPAPIPGRPGRPPVERIATERDRLAFAVAAFFPTQPEAIFWLCINDGWQFERAHPDHLRLSPPNVPRLTVTPPLVPFQLHRELRHNAYPDRSPGDIDPYERIFEDTWALNWRRRPPDRGDFLMLRERVERAFACGFMKPWTVEEALEKPWCQQTSRPTQPVQPLVAGVDYVPFDQLEGAESEDESQH